jgi:ABC-type bacteriocin/lantibiotic exporter with double-glycine peptidase domain
MEEDIEEVTKYGFMVIFELAKQSVKVCVILYFLVRRRPSMAIPLLVYPFCMAAVLNLRYEWTLKLKDVVRDAEKDTSSCLRESCDDINLIKEYSMRSAVVSRYEESILAQSQPGDDYGAYDFRTMLVMPWVTNLAIAIFMVVGGNFVLTGELSLGAYLASIGMYKDAGDLFNNFYIHLKECYGVIGPLLRVIRLLNLPTDVDASQKQAQQRHAGMMMELKSEENLRKQFALAAPASSRFDMLHIKLSHVSLANERGGPTYASLQDITVEVPQGKIVALLGTHGSGKYSLLRLLTGWVKPIHGEVHVPTFAMLVRS